MEPETGSNPTGEFEQLLEPVLEPAYRTAYHLTRNAEDAEELVQETALLALRGFHRFKPGTNFRAWFLTILRNQFVTAYRKQSRTVPTVEFDEAPDLYLYTKSHESGLDTRTADPARYLVASLDAEGVHAALDALPEDFRDVATLYFTQDLTYQEIADVLQIPVGTVRSRLHRGRRILQRELWHLAEEYGLVPSASTKEEST